MNLQRKRVYPNSTLYVRSDQAGDGMNVKEHSGFEAQLHDIAPLPETQIELLLIDRNPSSVRVDTFDFDVQADRARAILARRPGTGQLSLIKIPAHGIQHHHSSLFF